MNLTKHVKSLVEEWTFADFSQVPSHARSAHIVGKYIKDKKSHYTSRNPSVVRPAPLVVRLEGIPADHATRERIERQIRDANRQWRLANVPLRARVM